MKKIGRSVCDPYPYNGESAKWLASERDEVFAQTEV